MCIPCRKKYEKKNRQTDKFKNSNKIKTRRWRLLNPEKSDRTVQASSLKRLYGITTEQYENIIVLQNNGCGICGMTQKESVNKFKIRLVVDHNHETGEIRGVLCSSCNRSLGLLGDNIEKLNLAIEYLKKKETYGRYRL